MIPLRDTIPARRAPVVMWALVAINALVFLQELALGPNGVSRLFYLFGIVPARFVHPDWAAWVGFPIDDYWPFVTSMFLHASWAHIVGNMWTLWIFGDNVEDRMGHGRFLVFYLLCGVLAGVTHMLTNPHSTVPTVGASGAIAGVLGAYMRLYPHARIITLVPVFFWPFFFELPAAVFLFVWFFTQLWGGTLSGLAPGQAGGIAWWAHIGGFVVGFLLVDLFVPPRERGDRSHALDEAGLHAVWGPYHRR